MYHEMEFLDITLKKDSSLLLHAIQGSLLLADLKENHTLFWSLKICETRQLESIH
jgi:hypothetical protein